jgi:tetratricopeptide (TPR) repeat protein
VATALVLSACQGDEEKFAEHMSRGGEYTAERDWPAAIIEFKNALQLEPNNGKAHYELAKVYLANSMAREGFWELRETVRLDPENYDAKVQLAQLLVVAGDPDEAMTHADAAVALDANKAAGYLVRGQALNALSRLDESMDAFETAVRVAPDKAHPVLMLAIAVNERGDRAGAEPHFQKYAEMEPSFRSYTSLANFLSQDETRDAETEQAFVSATKHTSSPEEEVRAHAYVAGFFFQRERFDDANAYLETAIESVEQPLELIYLLARLHLAQGNQEKADALIEKATVANPDDPKPLLVLSAYRGRQGDILGALEAAERAIELDPDNTSANLRVAEILVDMGYRDNDLDKITRGREISEDVLSREPTHPNALMIKAKIDLAEKKVDDAIASLRAAIDAQPDLAQAHYILGTALSLKGDKTAARTELARALEIDASMLDARRVLARVHAMLGEHEYAVEEGRRFLREKPDTVDTRILVAQSLVILKRVDEALVELNQIPEDKHNLDVLYAIGRVHLRQGDSAQARAYLTKALELQPTQHDILRNLLRLDRTEGRFDESVARIAKAVEQAPDSSKLQSLTGVVALLDGRGEDAEAAFKKAVELDPGDVAGYEHLARLYASTGRLPDAVKTYEDAVEVRPDDANLHHFLGILYQYGGAREKAIERYKSAIEHSPDLAEAKNNLAYIYAESEENLDRALDLAQEAKAALPDSYDAADTLGWVLFKRGIPSAAISYLREAEAGALDANKLDSLGTIRHHLALAYEADGDAGKAGETIERALSDLDARAERQRAAGEAVGADPAWASPLREMQTRLSSGAG